MPLASGYRKKTPLPANAIETLRVWAGAELPQSLRRSLSA